MLANTGLSRVVKKGSEKKAEFNEGFYLDMLGIVLFKAFELRPTHPQPHKHPLLSLQ